MNPRDRYVFKRRLPGGTLSEVYHARDEIIGRDVAIKLFVEASPDEREREAFLVEARKLGGLQSPFIVELFHADIDEEGRPFLVERYYPGGSLESRKAEWPWTATRVRDVLVQIATALAVVHRAGIIHGDIKPANILLSDEGFVLADFGVARFRGEEGLARHGTIPYIAPECFARTGLYDGRVDLFALGMVACELRLGPPEFEKILSPLALGPETRADEWRDWLNSHDVRAPVSDDRDLDLVIEDLLQKDPAKRTPDATTLLSRLKGTGRSRPLPTIKISTDAGDTTQSPEPSPVASDPMAEAPAVPEPEPVSSIRWVLASVLVAALMAIAALVFYAFFAGHEDSQGSTVLSVYSGPHAPDFVPVALAALAGDVVEMRSGIADVTLETKGDAVRLTRVPGVKDTSAPFFGPRGDPWLIRSDEVTAALRAATLLKHLTDVGGDRPEGQPPAVSAEVKTAPAQGETTRMLASGAELLVGDKFRLHVRSRTSRRLLVLTIDSAASFRVLTPELELVEPFAPGEFLVPVQKPGGGGVVATEPLGSLFFVVFAWSAEESPSSLIREGFAPGLATGFSENTVIHIDAEADATRALSVAHAIGGWMRSHHAQVSVTPFVVRATAP